MKGEGWGWGWGVGSLRIPERLLKGFLFPAQKICPVSAKLGKNNLITSLQVIPRKKKNFELSPLFSFTEQKPGAASV